MKKIFLILTVVAVISCNTYDYRLKIKNLRAEPVYVAISKNKSLGGAIELQYNQRLKEETHTTVINFDSTERMTRESSKSWKNLARHSEDTKSHLFIINETTYKNNDWDKIVRNKLYKEKFIPLQELEKADWFVEIR